MIVERGLEVLSEDVAARLLASGAVGRVGVTIGALPAIFPVNYVVVDGAIDGVFTRQNRGDQVEELLARDAILKPEEIARNYVWLHGQGRSAWTHELDLRPSVETW